MALGDLPGFPPIMGSATHPTVNKPLHTRRFHTGILGQVSRVSIPAGHIIGELQSSQMCPSMLTTPTCTVDAVSLRRADDRPQASHPATRGNRLKSGNTSVSAHPAIHAVGLRHPNKHRLGMIEMGTADDPPGHQINGELLDQVLDRPTHPDAGIAEPDHSPAVFDVIDRNVSFRLHSETV